MRLPPPARQRRARAILLRLTAVLIVALAAARASGAAAPPQPIKKTLPNGLIVLIFEDPRLPIVSCRLVVRSGSSREAPSQAGLAALTARALLLGTDSTGAAAFRRALEATGAEMTASASYDYSLATLRAHRRHWERMLALFGEAVRRPAFGAEEWTALRTRTLNDARQALADPRRAADQHVDALLHGSTAYGRPLEGDPTSVNALLPDDGRRFHAEHWRPHNALLALAGDLRADEAFRVAERVFGGWERAPLGAAVSVTPPAPDRPRVRILDAPEAGRAQVRIGFVGPPRSDPDYLAAAALHVVLGGHRKDSRLSRALAERTDAAVPLTSTWSFAAASGSFVLVAEPPVAGVRAVVDAYRQAVDELRRAPVSAQELETARRILLGASVLAQESAGDRAERTLLSHVYGLGEDFLDTYEERLLELRPADLSRAASRFLRSDTVSVVAVGPAEAIRSQLVGLGPPEIRPLGTRTGVVPLVAIALPASPTSDTPEARRRARAVVDSAIAAHGGAQALERTESWRLAGALTLGLEGRHTMAPFAEVFAWPDRWRTEMVLEGKRVVRALDGESGWTAEGGSVTLLEPEVLAGFRLTSYGLPLVLLRAMASPAARLLYVSRETRDGRPVEVVDWLREDGGFTRAYFDAESKLLAAAEQTERAQGAAAATRVLRLYEDTRAVDGVVLPFVTVTYAGEVRASRQVLESVELSVPVSSETFRPPAR